ncbi:hypothetical protein, partial [Chitinophaga sp. GbtcB8]|uniref:hypothetical protein n=1 Tax=Chitinophaga sp. GbtcB8 TaxID=2824753 RepID=UPI001C2FF7D3
YPHEQIHILASRQLAYIRHSNLSDANIIYLIETTQENYIGKESPCTAMGTEHRKYENVLRDSRHIYISS